MKRRRSDEAQIQSCAMRHYRLRGAPDVVLFAVPNGGFRHRVEAARLKAQGVTAGIPDLIGMRDGRLYGFEIKAEREAFDCDLTSCGIYPTQKEAAASLPAQQGEKNGL